MSLQLYTVHVIQAGSSDKTPAIITRRYSDFQRLHSTLCRNYGDQMERVCFPRKCEFTRSCGDVLTVVEVVGLNPRCSNDLSTGLHFYNQELLIGLLGVSTSCRDVHREEAPKELHGGDDCQAEPSV